MHMSGDTTPHETERSAMSGETIVVDEDDHYGNYFIDSVHLNSFSAATTAINAPGGWLNWNMILGKSKSTIKDQG